MSLYPHISTESMEWDSFVVTGEPGTTADFFVESISSDESEEITDSRVADTDESPYSTEDDDVETDESPNLIEDCYDNIINDNPFEDLDFQNFLDLCLEINTGCEKNNEQRLQACGILMH